MAKGKYVRHYGDPNVGDKWTLCGLVAPGNYRPGRRAKVVDHTWPDTDKPIWDFCLNCGNVARAKTR